VLSQGRLKVKIELIESDDIHKIIPLLNTLDRSLTVETLKNRLTEMTHQGYQCVGMYNESKLIGICGIWIITKYYIGRHIEPDNMVFLPEYRSKGLGKKMMNWIYQYANSKGCLASELNCYIPNKRGQEFWEKEGYEQVAYHYQKKLKS
tara:strand:- start:10798 stop:11244 length:447 start_codon:yes stop_codon:yes gene_type:complete